MKELRLKEVSELCSNPTNVRSANAADRYLYRVVLETARYIRYVFWTWWGLAVTALVGGLGPFDCFSMFVYALGGTIVLFVVLVGCLILNSPPLTALFWWYSNKCAPFSTQVYNDNDFFFPLADLVGTWGSLTMLIRICSNRSNKTKWMLPKNT